MVLDTNVVLDLWLFQDPSAESLRSLLRQKKLTWLSNARCREELVRVLDYSEVERFLIRRGSDLSQAKSRTLDCFDELSVDVGQRPLPCPLPSCRDPDDQFLIDLAIGAGAEYLVTKDRHLLSMSASFRRAGFTTRITTPENMPSFASTSCGISCE